MSNLGALERLTARERLTVVGVAAGFFAALGVPSAALSAVFDRGTPAAGVFACYAVLCSLAFLSLVTLVQGVLGKRTVLTGWILDQLVARGEVLLPPSGAIAGGFPHLETIQRSLHALHEHLSGSAVRRFTRTLPQELANLDPNVDPVLAVERIAGTIAEHFGLPSGQITVSFDPALKHPGQVELTNQGVYRIKLHVRYRSERQQDIAAILAHEMTHIFLFRAGLMFPTTLDNEILTDVTAVYLGVGWLALNAYRRTFKVLGRHRGRVHTLSLEEKLGYLTAEEFGYVLAKRSLAFGESPHRLLTSQAAREAFRTGSRLALSEYKTPPLRDAGLLRRALYSRRSRRASRLAARPDGVENGRSYRGYRFETAETTRVVFECPVCGQKSRLPIGRGRLSAHCAVCDTELECET